MWRQFFHCMLYCHRSATLYDQWKNVIFRGCDTCEKIFFDPLHLGGRVYREYKELRLFEKIHK